jgi:hypothetical protein
VVPLSYRRSVLWVALALIAVSCAVPDPQKVVALQELEGYWAIDQAKGETQLIAPVVRFRARNTGEKPEHTLEFTANFRREGETQIWSSAWQRVPPPGSKDLAPGADTVVMLKPDNEGRYTSPGPPEGMFGNPQFKDVKAEIWARVGASPWVKMAELGVERRIGARSVNTSP